jgi:hypothetical protein
MPPDEQEMTEEILPMSTVHQKSDAFDVDALFEENSKEVIL